MSSLQNYRRLQDLAPDALVRLFEHLHVAAPIIAAVKADTYGGMEMFGPDAGGTGRVPDVIASIFDEETCRAHRIKLPHLKSLSTIMERLVSVERAGPEKKDKLGAEPPREEEQHGGAAAAVAVAAEPARVPPAPKPAGKKSKQARKQQPTVAAANDDDDAVELTPPPSAPAPRPLPKPAAKKINGDEKSARGIILNNENNERSQMSQQHEQKVKADNEKQQKQQQAIQRPRTDLVAKEKSERGAITKEEQTDFGKVRQQRSKSKKDIEELAMIDEMARRGQEKLRQQKPKAGELFAAVEAQDVSKVRELLERDADANERATFDCGANGPQENVPAIVAVCQQRRASPLRVVELLLAHGANPNSVEPHTRISLLAFSVMYGHPDVTRVLLARGAAIDARDKSGCTPLMAAALAGNTAGLKLLLQAGADVRAKAPDLGTAVHAAFRSELVHKIVASLQCLFDAYPSLVDERCTADDLFPIHVASQDNRLDVIELLLRRGAWISVTRPCGCHTPLYLAAERGHVDVVRRLLAASPSSIDTATCSGLTALHAACRNNKVTVAQVLLTAGAAVNAGDEKNATPLHIAAGAGAEECCRELLKAGADETLKTTVAAEELPKGATAYDVALHYGHEQLAEDMLSVSGDETKEATLQRKEEARKRKREQEKLESAMLWKMK